MIECKLVEDQLLRLMVDKDPKLPNDDAKLSCDELRRKPSKGEDVKLSWDELRRMPLDRVGFEL